MRAVDADGFEASNIGEASQRRTAPPWANPFFIRVPLLNPDRLLARLLPWVGWTFSRPVFLLWIVLCAAAIYQVGASWDRFVDATAGMLLPDQWLPLIFIWIGLRVLHELAHGLACKRWGGPVPQAGLAFILFSPVPYVNVTSCWRFPSK